MLTFEVRMFLTVASIAVALLAWLRLRSPRRSMFNALGAIMWTAFAVEVTGTILKTFFTPRGELYNGFVLVEFILVLVLVYTIRPRWRNALLVAAMLGLGGMAWSYWMHPELKFLLTEGILVMELVMVSFIMAVLWHLAQTSTVALHRRPAFWIFMGLLLYFAGSIPLIGAIRYLFAEDPAAMNKLWTFIPLLVVARYLLAAVACAIERNDQATDTSDE